MQHRKNRSIKKTLKHTLSIPFIYGMGISLILLHISLEIYHHVAFKLYGLELVDIKKYMKIDRYKLSKLTPLQKINCVYCGYANGLLPYATAISAETEKYWCGIKHQVEPGSKYIQPAHQNDFLEYVDFK